MKGCQLETLDRNHSQSTHVEPFDSIQSSLYIWIIRFFLWGVGLAFRQVQIFHFASGIIERREIRNALLGLLKVPTPIILHEILALFPQLLHRPSHLDMGGKKLSSFNDGCGYITAFPSLAYQNVLSLCRALSADTVAGIIQRGIQKREILVGLVVLFLASLAPRTNGGWWRRWRRSRDMDGLLNNRAISTGNRWTDSTEETACRVYSAGMLR
jgi:hypothetical protein